MSKIVVRADKLRRDLKRAANASVNLRDVWEDIGDELKQSVDQNFDAEGRPTKWTALSAAYKLTRKSGGILAIDDHLRNSINTRPSSRGVVVGSNLPYAAIHQFGGKTSAHKIKPRQAKVLSWGGGTRFARSVNHPGSTIPARPYLVIQDEDWIEFAAIIENWITGDFG